MSVIIAKKLARDRKKIWYTIEWGREPGQRTATGIFTYAKPLDAIQKNHNKESLAILETKKSQMILDHNSVGTNYIPSFKIKNNFFDYYEEFVKKNRVFANRSLEGSLMSFKKFWGKDFISATEITENVCKRYRDYLVKNFNGETPQGYFMRFKRVMKNAAKEGYYRTSPAETIAAKKGANQKKKEILDAEEYLKLMNTPCLNYEIKKAFVFSLYTALRWVDVSALLWSDIKENNFSITQKKTGIRIDLPLHPIIKEFMGERKNGLVFHLPSHEAANRILREWATNAGINKHITWHCARHSFSVLLQQKGVDIATVAGMLGHTSTKYVHQTYQRYVKDSAVDAINKLPA
jgi:integrase